MQRARNLHDVPMLGSAWIRFIQSDHQLGIGLLFRNRRDLDVAVKNSSTEENEARRFRTVPKRFKAA